MRTPIGISAGRARLRSLLRVLVVVAIAAFLAWQLHRDWPAVSVLRPRVRAFDLLAALLTGVGAMLALPTAFAVTLQRAGLYRPAFRWFYGRMWLQAYLFRYVPGKVMLVVERIRLGAMAGIDRGTSVLLLAWETLLLFVGAGVVLLSVAAISARGGERERWMAIAAVSAIALLVAFPWGLRLLGRLVPRLAWVCSLQLRASAQLLVVAIYAAVWLCLGTSFFFACRFFVDLPVGTLPAVVFWFTGAYVAGLVAAVAPAGLGVREGILAAGLAGLVGGGEAVALAIAGRLWLTAVELACVAATRAVPVPGQKEEGHERHDPPGGGAAALERALGAAAVETPAPARDHAGAE